MQWITATDLEQWATSFTSRHSLSRLVADLVRASATSVTAYRFPTGDSSELPGYDGILEAQALPPWVPDGTSVWEFGTGKDPRTKATDDYNKRTGNPGVGILQARTTFVFVTLRRWLEKKNWVEERQEGPWAAVNVLDAVDLEAWLDASPAVAARFASSELKLIPREGVRSAADFWDEYAASTTPRLTEQVLIAGRSKETDVVRAVLEQIPSRIVVRADSRDEALAFALATGRVGREELKRFLDSRTLVVDTDEAAGRLCNRNGLIVGLRAPLGRSAGLLLERGNSVIIPLGNDAPNQTGAIRLPRASTNEFADALGTLGLEEDKATLLARASGRSVTILCRRIPAGARRDPDWLHQAAYRDPLVLAMLAGAWDSVSPVDRSALETLSALTYNDFEARLRPVLHVADPPLQQTGTVWTVVAPVDLFESLAKYISQKNLQSFTATCTRVLGEVDPAVDLPPEERVYAGLHGKVLASSSWLRDGLTQTLLLISVRGDFAGIACAGGPQHFANGFITALPALRENHRLLASLRDQLPLLMEAVPDPLLSTLELLLEGDGTKMFGIFSESGWWGDSSHHTGLLCALESMAWNPQYFDRAIAVLVKLSRIDPGGYIANRPLNSLRAIFWPWQPSTNAPLAMRLGALDSVLERESQIGWNLLALLLPKRDDVSMRTSKPRWRDAGASDRERLTNKLVFDTFQAIVDRALSYAGDDANRWEQLITSMDKFDSASRGKVYDVLRQFATRVQDEQDRLRLWSALRNEINNHRRFTGADWTLPNSDLDVLDGILDQLAPSDLVEQHAWLFDQHDPVLSEPFHPYKIDAAKEPRRQAIETIMDSLGLDGVLRLAEKAKRRADVGVATGTAILDIEALHELIERSLNMSEHLESFPGALSAEATRRHGQVWTQWVIDQAMTGRWNARQVSAVVLCWPDQPGTWQLVSSISQDAERLYWTNKPMLSIDDPEDLAFAIKKYIDVDRAVAALVRFSHRSDTLLSAVLFQLVDASLQELATRRAEMTSNIGLELENILETLARRNEVDRAEVAKREYESLPLLDHRDRHLVLDDLLLSEPRFYVQILADVYKADSESADQDLTDEQIQRASMGFRLLRSIKRVPGMTKGGTLNGPVLRDWVVAVRELAAKAGRSEVGDRQIGELLAYAPNDDHDQAFPDRSVRDLIEELRSEAVESGVQSAQISKRGVFQKAVYEGGAQERRLAGQVRNWARASLNWPRTSAMLERIADMWEQYAKTEDENAEKNKLQFG